MFCLYKPVRDPSPGLEVRALATRALLVGRLGKLRDAARRIRQASRQALLFWRTFNTLGLSSCPNLLPDFEFNHPCYRPESCSETIYRSPSSCCIPRSSESSSCFGSPFIQTASPSSRRKIELRRRFQVSCMRSGNGVLEPWGHIHRGPSKTRMSAAWTDLPRAPLGDSQAFHIWSVHHWGLWSRRSMPYHSVHSRGTACSSHGRRQNKAA